MLIFTAAAFALAGSLTASDTTPATLIAFTDTAAVMRPAGVVSPAFVPVASEDTVRPRRKAVEVDDNYELRLRIHRYASYATIPLFALQTVAGNQLYQNGGKAGLDGWANVHVIGAAGLGALFTVNTVTGVWNLWSTRDQPEGRTKRLLHSALMLASDAGFTYVGFVSAGDAERSLSARQNHRNWAFASMGTALVGYGIMLIGNN